MRARRAAACILFVAALTGCAAPGRYVKVPVAPWNPTDAPWNSTLSGIATHYHVVGGYQTLARINHIANPSLLHIGQLIKVPRRHPAPKATQTDNE